MERSASEVATTRTHSKDRTRTTLKKPTQHFGTKQDAIVFSKARSLAVKTDRKTPKQHAPNMQARVVFLKEADELGHALETRSDATTPHWVKVGRMTQIPLSGKFATFRMKPVLGETFMPLRCVILEGGGNAELRAWRASLCFLSLKVTLHTLNKSVLVPLLLKSVSSVTEVGMFQRSRTFVAWMTRAANVTLPKV